jgi:hypothetical protein
MPGMSSAINRTELTRRKTMNKQLNTAENETVTAVVIEVTVEELERLVAPIIIIGGRR